MLTELKIDPWLMKHIQANRSLEKLALRLYRKGGSNATVATYTHEIVLFSKWLNMTPDQALAGKFDWAAVLNEYLDYVIVKNRLARSTAARKVTSVRKWLELNDVPVAWAKVEMPKRWKVQVDQIPTREQLKRILEASDLMEKVICLTAISSGLRASTILSLQLKDIERLDEDDGGNKADTLPIVRVRADISKGKRAYVTFLTPECAETIRIWLRERRMRGETITPDSYLVASEKFRAKRINKEGLWWRWYNMLERAGLGQKGEGMKWRLLHFHTLRKFYKSWASLSGMNQEVLEFTMGHVSSVRMTYFLADGANVQPEVIEKMEQEYRKAVPSLTILSESEEIRKLEETVEKQRSELDEQKRKFEEEKMTWQVEFVRMRKELDELIRIQESSSRKIQQQQEQTSPGTSNPQG